MWTTWVIQKLVFFNLKKRPYAHCLLEFLDLFFKSLVQHAVGITHLMTSATDQRCEKRNPWIWGFDNYATLHGTFRTSMGLKRGDQFSPGSLWPTRQSETADAFKPHTNHDERHHQDSLGFVLRWFKLFWAMSSKVRQTTPLPPFKNVPAPNRIQIVNVPNPSVH